MMVYFLILDKVPLLNGRIIDPFFYLEVYKFFVEVFMMIMIDNMVIDI